ncbi:VOC family protein [Phenylobacterium sp.]|uniref:VOC family protein n=1 Tax=Phenylobacterium sp. TaxID=1871053 RepID=UPI0035B45B42
MADAAAKRACTPTVFYKDPKAALDWLERAFGFEIAFLVTDDAGNIGHAEMTFRGCTIGVGGEWAGPQLGGAAMKSPASLGGASSQFIWFELEADIDGHCERARAAGAKIAQEPEDQFYGARIYRALDPEGQVWCFRQEVRSLTVDQMEAASGLKNVSKPPSDR